MIIENKSQLDDFLKGYSSQDSIIIPIQNDENKHPIDDDICLLYIQLMDGSEYEISRSGDLDVKLEWITPDNTPDSSLPPVGSSATVPDIGLGLYFTSENYYLGLSATHIIPFEADFNGVATFNPARHYYLSAGYDYDLNEDFSLRPSYYMKTDGVVFQMDFNCNAFYKQKHWAGFSYRIEDAFAFLIGFEIQKSLTLGYAYDVVTSKLASETTGGHELMLRYSFKLESQGRPDTRYKNIRFL